jgi:hypothetical protein
MESSFCSCEEEMGSLKRWEIWRDGKFDQRKTNKKKSKSFVLLQLVCPPPPTHL